MNKHLMSHTRWHVSNAFHVSHGGRTVRTSHPKTFLQCAKLFERKSHLKMHHPRVFWVKLSLSFRVSILTFKNIFWKSFNRGLGYQDPKLWILWWTVYVKMSLEEPLAASHWREASFRTPTCNICDNGSCQKELWRIICLVTQERNLWRRHKQRCRKAWVLKNHKLGHTGEWNLLGSQIVTFVTTARVKKCLEESYAWSHWRETPAALQFANFVNNKLQHGKCP